MSDEIKTLQPQAVWKYFYDLTQIPRPSTKEAAAVAYAKKFGEDLGLETLVDEVGNVIIRKPATPGMENRKGIILQGHLDMVPQANSDTPHDFEKDPIRPRIDGDWVKATGTTLGADNGIGVATTMAILAAKNLKHGPIEALMTIDEETGMTGAVNLKAGMLKGDIFINLDSEEEGEVYVGCAGGTNANITLPIEREPVPAGDQALKITISGLKGGHSGVDIPLERGNSNKIMFRLLYELTHQYGVRIAEIDGGNLRNAIPREAIAVIVVKVQDIANVKASAAAFAKILQNEFSSADPGVTIAVQNTDKPASVLDMDSASKLIKAVYSCPNGVIRMSTDMIGLVETSTNLAIVKSEEKLVFIKCLLRSSVDSAREDLKNMFTCVFSMAGADIMFDGEYPGWKSNMDSQILKEAREVYLNLFGKVPDIKAIHAGLECGILGGVYTNWDMLSVGPTIKFPHSPDEKVNIESVQKFWTFITAILEKAPVK
ncbi:MAG: aminoacyl-histidine dipeptidase [Bacteroidales bacterium]|nr:aminoacyl-histidine dipeptidase [Bacteroidales bacterium]